MNRACRPKGFRTVQTWWLLAARTLAFVLVLTLALPTGGLLDDMAFHEGHHRQSGLALSVEADTAGGHQAADPGLTLHVHCGCHLTVSPCNVELGPPPSIAKARFAWTREAVSSIDPDTPSRPPRV